MIEGEQLDALAVDYLREFYKECECKNNDDLIRALSSMINKSAFLIKRFSDEDRAQCALYEPYRQLMGD